MVWVNNIVPAWALVSVSSPHGWKRVVQGQVAPGQAVRFGRVAVAFCVHSVPALDRAREPHGVSNIMPKCVPVDNNPHTTQPPHSTAGSSPWGMLG